MNGRLAKRGSDLNVHRNGFDPNNPTLTHHMKAGRDALVEHDNVHVPRGFAVYHARLLPSPTFADTRRFVCALWFSYLVAALLDYMK
ncbi:MAG: hypothetical protein MUF54_15160 [Polyangiaceae bacterium]|jgi:hypothetical protein|nr:hypothetical protein [Polyangiaceae bacterium]